MKIYTKTGDDGTTGLLARGRLGKDHLRIEAYGTVDELNATLGVARSLGPSARIDAVLTAIQNELFAVGASLADPDPEGRFHQGIGATQIEGLERHIDAFEAELPPLTQFILPGGSAVAAHLHLGRTVCRRGERVLVHLQRQADQFVAPLLVPYLNRLSDLLFVLARFANHETGTGDTPWTGL